MKLYAIQFSYRRKPECLWNSENESEWNIQTRQYTTKHGNFADVIIMISINNEWKLYSATYIKKYV